MTASNKIITGKELMSALESNYKLACLELIADRIEEAKDAIRAMLTNIEQWEAQNNNNNKKGLEG